MRCRREHVCTQLGDEGKKVLTVVYNEQKMTVGEVIEQSFAVAACGLVSAGENTKYPGREGVERRLGINVREADEPDSVGECAVDAVRCFAGYACFADATGTGQGYQSAFCEGLAGGLELLSASDET